MVFETVPFVDWLMGDLGLERRRKGGWRELFEPYGVEDYRGVVGEWMERTEYTGEREAVVKVLK